MKESKKGSLRMDSRTGKICFCAVFTAIVCACTFISIPLPIGYFNLGDVAVLVSAYMLGPIWGTVAAAVGSALTDLLMGYTLYAPATLIIKGLVALVACTLYTVLKKIITKDSVDFLPRAISAIIGEVIMVGGYFAYEALVLSYGFGAIVSVPGNAIQALCGVIGSVLFMSAIRKIKLR